LELSARYRITPLGKEAQPFELTGKELMEYGIPITLSEKPSALFVIYEKIKW